MNSISKRRLLLRVLIVAVTTLMAFPAFTGSEAANFPEKEITMVIPMAPGGATDLMFKALAPTLEKALGVPVVFVYKPGGGNAIGWAWLARQKPDGYTVGAGTISLPLQQHMATTDLHTDQFSYIGLVGGVHGALSVRQDSPFKTLKDLIDYGKKNPGVITVSNGGTGSSHHVNAAGLEKAAGVKFTHVPFTGGGPAAVAMLGGHVTAGSSTVGEVFEFVQAGKARILGIPSETRYDLVPDVPTYREQGYDYVFDSRSGVIAPKGVPADVARVLSAAVEKAVKSEQYISTMKRLRMVPTYMNGKEYADWIYQVTPKLKTIMIDAGVIK